MPETLLQIENVSKKFPGVQALDAINLEIFPGEVHAIVGENGAGKSTLMHILSGVQARDEGRLLFKSQEVTIADPRNSQQIGISTVYQELALAQNMSIMDNVFLWNMPRDASGLVDQKKLYQNTQRILQELGVSLDPATLVKKLSVSEKQLVEIAKALSMNAALIIMDEPNSALSPAETQFLFKIIQQLKARGVTILFISHRLDEVFEIADRITVLRDGRLIGTLVKSEATVDQVISMMVGRELKQILYTRTEAPEQKIFENGVVLSVRNLSLANLFKDVSFDLHQGEILGIFGLVGAGRTQLAETIFGLRRAEQGEIAVDKKTAWIQSPDQAVNLGIGFIPEDRKLSGLFLKMTVEDNLNMTSFQKLSRGGLVNLSQARSQAKRLSADLDIRLANLSQIINSLSGGNQQKAILARWLALNPHILIMDEPTRGIDVGAKAQIYEIIHRLAENKVAILLISSEIEEILAISDNILVMRRGLVSARLHRSQASSDLLLKHAA
ncbi:MAG: sugar ABC transporter ATP-binding protein [Anaerolineales bacterium]|jgi:ABC-type sugar transport system ATPase subunit|nr:sugar ABC transporter ATP-binding protein [Anaerolineales bacterium]